MGDKIMSDCDYLRAKEKLENLRVEQFRLPSELRDAANIANATEIARLRQRQAALPSEIFPAEVMLRQANIERLKLERAAAHNRIDSAKLNSKQVDARAVAAMRVLDGEKQKINTEALEALTAIYAAQNDVNRVNDELNAEEKALSALLSEAA
jgi:hypothetical protein